MSQDLFAAFGEESSESVWGNEATLQHNSFASKDDTSNVWSLNHTASWNQGNHVKTDAAEVDEDDFGDFEDASTPNPIESSPSVGAVASAPISRLTAQQPSALEKTASKTAISSKSKDVAPLSSSLEQQAIGHHPFAGRMDLLFETGDDEYDAGADELADLATNPEAAMAYSKRIIAQQEAAQLRSKDTVIPKETSPKSGAAVPSNDQLEASYDRKQPSSERIRDPNVLFDADDLSEQEDDEDDFDDFENAEEITAPARSRVETTKDRASTMPSMDILGLDETPPRSNMYHNAKPPNGERTSTIVWQEPTATYPQPPAAIIPKEEEDFWDDFETSAPVKASTSSKQDSPPSSTGDIPRRPQKAPLDEQSTLPPTNVPPPAVLLSIFPAVFADADEALFNTIAKLDMKQKQMLLAHPASHQFLKRYLGHCTALARIIAGRKVRWKRDQRLSQSMRIGPAAAGGKGGMKLTGLDKSEVAKEDREVVDVLRLWKVQIGKLRTAVTAASAAPGLPKLPSVPEITDQMSVKTLKSVEGGLTAPQPCALCGLKREERVAKVDLEVDDSFGEWWVQGMNMHLACRNFWEEFEKRLKSK